MVLEGDRWILKQNRKGKDIFFPNCIFQKFRHVIYTKCGGGCSFLAGPLFETQNTFFGNSNDPGRKVICIFQLVEFELVVRFRKDTTKNSMTQFITLYFQLYVSMFNLRDSELIHGERLTQPYLCISKHNPSFSNCRS